MPSSEEWGTQVVAGTYGGHPGLVYEQRPRSVSAVLRQAATWGDRTFIVHGSRQVSFGDLVAMVDRVKAYLATSGGVREGDRVGIFAANSPEWVATFFAVIGLGAIAAPCNGWWSAEEMQHGNRLAGLTLVVADARRRERVPAGLPVIEMESLPTGRVATVQPPQPEPDEERPAVILFTAGTTAFPKGAVLSHRALIANLQTLLVVSRKLPHQLTPDARASVTLVGLPLFHIGAIQLILVPMMTGNRIVFLEGRFDGAEVLRLIEAENVTMFSGVPTMMERLLRHPDLPRRNVASLRTIVLGGSPVSSELLDRITAAFPGAGRGVGQTYGLTEAGGVVSTGVGSGLLGGHRGSSGRLAPVVEVRILDPDAQGIGEILVRSPACMSGYWGQPGASAPTADGWLHTGDLGWVDDDRYLYVTGRLKDVIIRGGENVSSSRVEAVLQEHPGVLEVAVVGLPDDDLGEIVGAVVRIDPRCPVGQAELELFAREKLAHFAVPSRWWFVADPLPTNDSGKVLKAALVAAWQRQLTPTGGADA